MGALEWLKVKWRVPSAVWTSSLREALRAEAGAVFLLICCIHIELLGPKLSWWWGPVGQLSFPWFHPHASSDQCSGPACCSPQPTLLGFVVRTPTLMAAYAPNGLWLWLESPPGLASYSKLQNIKPRRQTWLSVCMEALSDSFRLQDQAQAPQHGFHGPHCSDSYWTLWSHPSPSLLPFPFMFQ